MNPPWRNWFVAPGGGAKNGSDGRRSGLVFRPRKALFPLRKPQVPNRVFDSVKESALALVHRLRRPGWKSVHFLQFPAGLPDETETALNLLQHGDKNQLEDALAQLSPDERHLWVLLTGLPRKETSDLFHIPLQIMKTLELHLVRRIYDLLGKSDKRIIHAPEEKNQVS